MTMPRKKRIFPKFKGALNTPLEIHRPAPGLCKTEAEINAYFDREQERLAAERVKKLELLCVHYGITFEQRDLRYAALALNLVQDLGVPGFQILDDPLLSIGQTDRKNRQRGARWRTFFVKTVDALQRAARDNGRKLSNKAACAWYAEH